MSPVDLALFVAVTLLLPRGIVGTVRHWWNARRPPASDDGVKRPTTVDPRPAE